VTHVGEVIIVYRSRGHPAVSDDVGRGTLTDGGLRAAIHEDGKVGVSMNINEARSDKVAVYIDNLPSPEGAGRGNLNNPTSPDREVAPEPGISTPI